MCDEGELPVNHASIINSLTSKTQTGSLMMNYHAYHLEESNQIMSAVVAAPVQTVHWFLDDRFFTVEPVRKLEPRIQLRDFTKQCRSPLLG